MNKFFKNVFFQILILIFFIILGYWVGEQLGVYFSARKTEEHSQIIHSVKSISKISTYKIHQIEEFEWDNNSQNSIANLLFYKKLHISVPIVATYGFEVDSTHWQYSFQKDTLCITFPQPKLLNFEVLWNEKKVFSEKGLLQFENDHQFDELEKLFHQEKHKYYQNYSDALKESKKTFKNQVVKFYKNLGYEIKFLEK